MGSAVTGLAACGVSTVLFGSMFVPIKRRDPGDGFFVQWVMCAAIFLSGMIINAYEGFPKFYPLAMLGGMLWTIGNATAIPILKSIGLGMGILIWGITNCLFGWASSRFGLFGLKKNVPSSVALNYIGLAHILFGGVLFALIKPTMKTAVDNASEISVGAMRTHQLQQQQQQQETNTEETRLLRNNENNVVGLRRRILGIALALFAGAFYGTTFVPVIYVQEHPDMFPGAPSDALPYVFAHYTGIFVTSTIIMIAYAIFMWNKPVVNNEIILPGFLSGIMWSIAQTSWFIANNYIAQSISFPINSMVPGVIAALWGVFYFREISGKRNLCILSGAITITVFGALLVGLSKEL